MTMEEKLELLPELLMLADLSKETTSEEASEQVDLGASEDKDMSVLWQAAGEMCAPAACT